MKRTIKHIIWSLSILIGAMAHADEKGHDNAVFIENKGQWQEFISYKLELNQGALFFENTALTYMLISADDWEDCCGREQHNHNATNSNEVTGFAYQAKWLDANTENAKVGLNPRYDHRNYLKGNDPDKWAKDVKLYKHLKYLNIYNKIDVEFYGVDQDLKYNWIVHPGGNPENIKTEYSSNVNVSIVNGDLWIDAPTGKIIEKAPFVFQMINGKRKVISSKYELNGNVVSIQLGRYNSNFDLIIDPTVEFSSYSGSAADNWGFTATYDDDGNLYGAGIVFDVGYPITANNIGNVFHPQPPFVFDPTTDIGLTKFNSDGTARIYSTYIGGDDVEQPHSMIVNSQGELIMFGSTGSLNFPVRVNGYQNTHGGGPNLNVTTYYKFTRTDIFVIKINAQGNFMTGGTFFGGSDSDGINNSNVKNYGDKSRGEVVVDDQDNIYIASSTRSSDFPTAGSPQQTSLKGVQDGIVAKFNPNLSTLLWSTYFGGSSIDGAFSITLNPNGDVYACGPTNSNDLAMTTGALNSTHQGSNDGWVARFNGNTGALIKTSYLGTGASDQAFLIDSDKNNGIYVFGQSLGAYPVSPGVYSNPGSKQFIQKLSPDLSQSVFSTVIGSGGGNINIVPTAFNVDDCLNILISGWGGNTNAPNQQVNPGQLGGNTFGMPVTNDAYQSSTDGSDFYFMVLGNDASSLVYGSYFGGNQSDEHVDGGTSRFSPDGNIYQAVCAGCGATNFPTTPGALSTQNGAANTFGCNLGVIKVNFETSITAGLDVDWNADVDTNCNTLTIKFQNTSRNANSYVWDLGNGQTSTDKEPTGTYTSFGTYTVMLIAIDTICDISDTVSMVFDHDTGIVPVADFEVNYVSCDLTREVNINNKSRKGANSFFWDFGDGNTSTQQSPQHNYANSGVYTITLIAYNTLCNNSDTLVKQVDFDYDIPPPEVRVTANPCGNGSIAVELENDSAWYSYTWEFSDGTIEQGRNPKHKFTISDTYSVYLKITDSLCNNEFEFNFTEYFLISENRLYIPTAFTPNGDLNNEEFIISGNSCLEDSEFIILNAFGEEIFRTDKPFEEFWDGTYNGQPAQEDVYVYRFNSKTITRNGYIVLYH